MSKPLALVLYAALSAASVLLWVSYRIERACSWLVPDDGDDA